MTNLYHPLTDSLNIRIGRKKFLFLIALAMKAFKLSSKFGFVFLAKIDVFPRTKKISQKVSKMGAIARNV